MVLFLNKKIPIYFSCIVISILIQLTSLFLGKGCSLILDIVFLSMILVFGKKIFKLKETPTLFSKQYQIILLLFYLITFLYNWIIGGNY
jgi:hypothetical protein